MEAVISKIPPPPQIALGPTDKVWIFTFDLDYSYGQLLLAKEAGKMCIPPVPGDILPATSVS